MFFVMVAVVNDAQSKSFFSGRLSNFNFVCGDFFLDIFPIKILRTIIRDGVPHGGEMIGSFWSVVHDRQKLMNVAAIVNDYFSRDAV